MGKPHPIELRERAVRLVEQGSTHTEAARRLCVSIKFVNDMVRLKRETGSLAPKPQGNPGRGKLTGVKGWVERRIGAARCWRFSSACQPVWWAWKPAPARTVAPKLRLWRNARELTKLGHEVRLMVSGDRGPGGAA
jgi:hypothetical protein